jgi:hypothetical protein
MNKLRSIAIAGIVALLAASPALADEPASTNAASDFLFFRDGDMLYGKLLAIEAHNAIRWQHPDAVEPIEFKPESVSQIEFPPVNATAAQSNSSCRVYFGNGDTMEGNLVSCDRDTLTLDTWYANRLTISRALPQNPVRTVAFLPRQPAMFDGLTGMDGWTQGSAVKALESDSGEWVYRHGAFYADKPASIARDLNLPDRVEIQFDLAWKGQFNIAVALYTDSLQPILLTAKDQGPAFGAFYSLRFTSPYFISLMPIRKNDPLRSLELMVPSLNNKDHIHVDLRMSKPDHRVVLFLDGAMIKEWIDPVGFTAEGKGMRFVQNPGGSIKLSHLRVAAWNGVLDEAPAVSPDPGHDLISMESGPKTSGQIQSIANGEISVLGTGGLTKLAVNKVSAIDFAGITPEAPKTTLGSVHATFARGGFVTFDLLSWRPDGMVVTSPVFGKATFDPVAFSRLQFIARDPRSADEPKG